MLMLLLEQEIKTLVILEDEMRKVAKNLYISTDDGSYGFNGRVTDCLTDLVENNKERNTTMRL